MDIPHIGRVRQDDKYGDCISEPMAVRFLRGHRCRFVLEGYIEDERQGDFHRALQNALAADEAVLTRAQEHVLQYCRERLEIEPDEAIRIETPADVWKYVQFGSEIYVSRRDDGDDEDGIYLSLECDCDWEPEHGLQLVLRDGLEITKVGEFDDHVTNSDAYDDPDLKGVVYVSVQ